MIILGKLERKYLLVNIEGYFSSFIFSYVRLILPNLPQDGVSAVVNHLTTEQMLAHISFHIGTKDLVLSEVNGLRFLAVVLSFLESYLLKQHRLKKKLFLQR